MVQAQQKLSIMSYNIHRGQDANNKDKLKAMADLINNTGAEIVGLQEVDSVCYRSGKVDQAKKLAELTGMHYAYVRHFAFQGGSYGLALLSKHPISNVSNHRLPIKTPGETRAFLTADITLSNGEKWTVGVAHLDYRDSTSRTKQAREVVNIYENTPRGILLGDMNAEPRSKTISILLNRFQQTQPDHAFTFPSPVPEKKIDYIFVKSLNKSKVKDHKVIAVDFSDHCPILSRIVVSN